MRKNTYLSIVCAVLLTFGAAGFVASAPKEESAKQKIETKVERAKKAAKSFYVAHKATANKDYKIVATKVSNTVGSIRGKDRTAGTKRVKAVPAAPTARSELRQSASHFGRAMKILGHNTEKATVNMAKTVSAKVKQGAQWTKVRAKTTWEKVAYKFDKLGESIGA